MRLLAALALSGCATIVASGPDLVPVATNPQGAYVYLNGVLVGQSPLTVSLDRGRPAQLQIYLPGFQPVVMVRHKSLNGWFFANLLWLATIVPIIIDIVTDNYQRYDDDAIRLGLVPAQGPAPDWYRPAPQPYIPPPAR